MTDSAMKSAIPLAKIARGDLVNDFALAKLAPTDGTEHALLITKRTVSI